MTIVNDYLNYMSKMNEELITNMLLDNGYISSNGVPQLDVQYYYKYKI